VKTHIRHQPDSVHSEERNAAETSTDPDRSHFIGCVAGQTIPTWSDAFDGASIHGGPQIVFGDTFVAQSAHMDGGSKRSECGDDEWHADNCGREQRPSGERSRICGEHVPACPALLRLGGSNEPDVTSVMSRELVSRKFSCGGVQAPGSAAGAQG